MLGSSLLFQALIAGIIASPSWASPLSKRSPPTAVTKNGTIQGLSLDGYNQEAFLGIPYAQPPTGNLRWVVPQSVNTSFDTLVATSYGPECIGYGSDQYGYETSEDCLTLNVVRPTGYKNKKLPVAVWIHGGGLYMGGSRDKRYNLTFIIEQSVKIGQPIIGVSLNYRLGPWGFLEGNEIYKEGSTNLGIRDQRLGLHWVHENIAAFGGDPSKVTIWGESAGALSVGTHLIAYGGRDDGLFRGAIMESGNPILYAKFKNISTYEVLYNKIATSLGCDNATNTLDCLRGLPLEALNTTFSNSKYSSAFSLVIDGDVIQKKPSVQMDNGEFVKVPIISGANTDEGTAFGTTGVQNETALMEFWTDTYGLPEWFAEKLADAYPDNPCVGIPACTGCSRPDSTRGYEYKRVAAFAGDFYFIASRRATCEYYTASNIPAYCYRFNTRPAGLALWYGVTHFQEVAFVFYNVDGLGYDSNPYAWTGKEATYKNLGKLMSSHWASFVHSQDPNAFRQAHPAIAGKAPKWPKYGKGYNMVWDVNVTALAFSEPDTWRSEGISLMNKHAADVLNR